MCSADGAYVAVPVLAPPLTVALLAGILLADRVAVLPVGELQQLVQHLVMLRRKLVDFPALHFFQLPVDDGSQTVPDGHDGRCCVEVGSRLRAASFRFEYSCWTR